MKYDMTPPFKEGDKLYVIHLLSGEPNVYQVEQTAVGSCKLIGWPYLWSILATNNCFYDLKNIFTSEEEATKAIVAEGGVPKDEFKYQIGDMVWYRTGQAKKGRWTKRIKIADKRINNSSRNFRVLQNSSRIEYQDELNKCWYMEKNLYPTATEAVEAVEL